MTRADITFGSGDTFCAGWHYTPDGADADDLRPIVVMAHGLGGVKEERLDAFAERFTAAGYACLVFDYRNFGASGGRPRQVLDIQSQLADWRAAVSYARSLRGADPDRVVVWGTSFGGGHVIVTAADDHRVVAAISQCPFTDGLASALATDTLPSIRVTGLAIRDAVAARRGRAPVMIPTSGPPGSATLMNAPDCESGIAALKPAGTSGRTEVAAPAARTTSTRRPAPRRRRRAARWTPRTATLGCRLDRLDGR
ncbi:alpha/beta hydrolase [Nocardioides sp. R-C-SC26]|uniref:alpha/beta hydrolase n=1 Tax=Nocardioides sp. R-C-SC26 TaxID=2870414 RepID=UPI001E29CBB6|nr:alpha/beta fold hydrolase [Nocardioides sp. R-C-SC26]